MIKRIASLLLAIVLTALLIPAPVSAAATEAADIEQLIKTTYRSALRYHGKSSLRGLCGTMVNTVTYLLGIDDHVYGCDGYNEYDLYAKMGTTAGGYRVDCYPASQYTLESALNAITANGTQDAYNILVGFQKTNTAQGSIYGHAMLIYAILDGTVYFAESYNTSIGGKYWAEGSAISCSIETFCDYYNSWTVFDGIAYFGVKTYADVCKEYPASGYAMAPEVLDIYEEPSDPGVYEAAATGETLCAGEKVKVTALLQTPGGEYWYQLDGQRGYVRASDLVWIADCCEDVAVGSLKIPTNVRRKAGFSLGGTVSSGSCKLTGLQVIVYTQEKGIHEPEFSGALELDAYSVSLSEKQLDKYMTFRDLEAGSYCIAIVAEMESYVLENGEPVSHSVTAQVWNSQFLIITGWNYYPIVTFDGNGGDAELDQMVFTKGDALTELPTASREGYVFAGWSYDPEGSEMVPQDAVIEADTTLYAQWKKGISSLSGWQQTENGWSYYEDGTPVQGWFEYEGLKFYQLSDGTMARGWETVDGTTRYFNKAGVMLIGWQNIGDSRYYLNDDGTKACGWLQLDGEMYYFSQTGRLQTQWVHSDGKWYYMGSSGCMTTGNCTIGGAAYQFRGDGTLQYAQQLTGNGSYYLVYDRNAARETLDPSVSLLLA